VEEKKNGGKFQYAKDSVLPFKARESSREAESCIIRKREKIKAEFYPALGWGKSKGGLALPEGERRGPLLCYRKGEVTRLTDREGLVAQAQTDGGKERKKLDIRDRKEENRENSLTANTFLEGERMSGKARSNQHGEKEDSWDTKYRKGSR